MRVSRVEKDLSHRRIVASAAKIARQRGVDAASVGDIMSEAGLTHGGFYKHFGSKEALLASAIDQAFDEMADRLEADPESAGGAATAARFEAFYLSDGHLASPGIGCPIAALGGDIARGATALKVRFGAGVRRMVDRLAPGMPGSAEAKRVHAIRRLALMSGAIAISRASDPDTAREVLEACRRDPTLLSDY